MARRADLRKLHEAVYAARDRFENEVMERRRAGATKAQIAAESGLAEGTIRAIVAKYEPDAPDERTRASRRRTA